jgi:hypothetical protein
MMVDIFENQCERDHDERISHAKKVETEICKIIEKNTKWKLRKSSDREDKMGIDYWGSYDGQEEITIQLKHRSNGSGDDFLMELSKNWVGDKTAFDGKESKKVDAYFFITKDMEMYVFDGPSVKKRCNKAFRAFYNRFVKCGKVGALRGRLDGEVRIIKKKSAQDTKKKCAHTSDQKLLYFCPAKSMKRYKELPKVYLNS